MEPNVIVIEFIILVGVVIAIGWSLDL